MKEITLDLAGNMALIAQKSFPNAVQVFDRFHFQQLATEALQEMRIKYRWLAIDQENQAIEDAKKDKINYLSPELTGLNSLYGCRSNGFKVNYKSITGGARSYQKETNSTTSDWIETIWSTGVSSIVV